jgi:hypothetical protein
MEGAGLSAEWDVPHACPTHPSPGGVPRLPDPPEFGGACPDRQGQVWRAPDQLAESGVGRAYPTLPAYPARPRVVKFKT